MKKIISYIGILSFVCFSFYYTDKVINYINNKDPLMEEINSKSTMYEIMPVNAITDSDTIIPGINGIKVNIEKSYNNMKLNKIFREDLLIYDTLLPKSSLNNNKNKYIISGNKNKNNIAILIILNIKDIDKLSNIDNLNIFINHNDLTISNIIKLKNNEVYTYGNNGKYSKEVLINDNSIINRISNNNSIYCLTKEKNIDVLNNCNNENMFIIIPSLKGDYVNIKNNIENGSIILLDNIDQIDIIIKYIKGKGYNIVPLSILLKE